MQRNRGFTLVEMLLVVAVIALLIAILLPSLSRGKENARRSVCASNLHGVGASLDQYVIDFRRRYPGGNATLSPGYGIDSSYAVSTHFPMGLAYLITTKYCNTPQLFYCPSWTHPWNQFGVVDVAGNDPWFGPNEMGGWPGGNAGPTSHRGFSYHYRSSFGPGSNRPPSLTLPGNTSIFADHFVQREVLYGNTYGHKDGYNVLSLGGAVTWRPDAMGRYMLTMQPPQMGITNGNWTYQEVIWKQFFDQQ